MRSDKALEQHIAVFGEGGSGKTVLISSFYGATQEPQFLQEHVFHVLADKIGDGARLHQNYLGTRDAARVPMLSLKDDLLADGKPLVEFPRIWIMALSKSDLLPDTDVFAFRDLLVSKVSEEIGQLRQLLAGFVEASDALAVGEDFLLLSSARFDAGRIEVTRRVGLDLILPLAAMLPFERHVRWSKTMQLPGKVAENLLDRTGAVAAALLSRALRRSGPVGLVMGLFSPNVVDDAVKLAGDQLKALNAEARAKHDHLTATLTRFRMDLDEAEDERVLLKSRR